MPNILSRSAIRAYISMEACQKCGHLNRPKNIAVRDSTGNLRSDTALFFVNTSKQRVKLYLMVWSGRD